MSHHLEPTSENRGLVQTADIRDTPRGSTYEYGVWLMKRKLQLFQVFGTPKASDIRVVPRIPHDISRNPSPEGAVVVESDARRAPRPIMALSYKLDQNIHHFKECLGSQISPKYR